MNEILEALVAIAPSLIFVLLVYLALYKFAEKTRKLFDVVVDGVTLNAQKNALDYAIVLLCATLASLQTLRDVAQTMAWQWVFNACSVIQPGLAVIVAAASRAAGRKDIVLGTPSATTPPFPQPQKDSPAP